jgi:hypothetical protein
MKEARPMTDPMTNIRQLPIYVEGFHAGQDTGLRIALDAITQERIRQTHMQATHDAASPAAARHEYAAARRVDVSKVIGARFRQ